MNLAKLNKIYQILRLGPFLIMFIVIALLTTRIIEPNVTVFAILFVGTFVWQIVMVIIKLILSRAGFSNAIKRRVQPGDTSTPGSSSGASAIFNASTAYTSSAVFGASPKDQGDAASPVSDPEPTATSATSAFSYKRPTPVPAGVTVASPQVSDPSQTVSPAGTAPSQTYATTFADTSPSYGTPNADILFIENVFEIAGVGAVVSGTLVHPVAEGQRILVRNSRSETFEAQVTGLQIWNGAEYRTTGRAIMSDTVSFRLPEVDAKRIHSGDMICSAN